MAETNLSSLVNKKIIKVLVQYDRTWQALLHPVFFEEPFGLSMPELIDEG